MSEKLKIEILNDRTENSKTYDIGNGKKIAEICIGAIHYKDDYKDEKEQFKEIDLTWVDNKITKAPYTLERVGNKINVLDKKTGKTSSIELDSIGDEKLSTKKSLTGSKTTEIVKDVDVEIIAAPDSIRYQTIIKDEKALKDLKYKITGDIPISYSAVDDDGEAVPLITSVSKEGILTESVDVKSFTSEKAEKTKIKYPIKIDPTLTLSMNKDTLINEAATTTNYGSSTFFAVNNRLLTAQRVYSLIEVSLSSLPAGSTVSTATFSAYYYTYDGTSLNPNGKACVLNPLRRADWVEAQATWDIYKTGSNWGTAGALNTTTDYDDSISSSVNFPLYVGAWMEWDVKNLITSAQSNGTNFNVRMYIDWTINSFPSFYSKEYSTNTGLRPKLVIEYNIKRRKIFFI